MNIDPNVFHLTLTPEEVEDLTVKLSSEKQVILTRAIVRSKIKQGFAYVVIKIKS